MNQRTRAKPDTLIAKAMSLHDTLPQGETRMKVAIATNMLAASGGYHVAIKIEAIAAAGVT